MPKNGFVRNSNPKHIQLLWSAIARAGLRHHFIYNVSVDGFKVDAMTKDGSTAITVGEVKPDLAVLHHYHINASALTKDPYGFIERIRTERSLSYDWHKRNRTGQTKASSWLET